MKTFLSVMAIVGFLAISFSILLLVFSFLIKRDSNVIEQKNLKRVRKLVKKGKKNAKWSK